MYTPNHYYWHQVEPRKTKASLVQQAWEKSSIQTFLISMNHSQWNLYHWLEKPVLTTGFSTINFWHKNHTNAFVDCINSYPTVYTF
jgi:hypothetical protein